MICSSENTQNPLRYKVFGSVMPGRQYNAGDYRYGFNGMEQDDEVKGNSNSLDFGSRIYDPRIGRWLSLDPLMAKYPSLSPYNFALNNPILFVDPNGEEGVVYIQIMLDEQGEPVIDACAMEEVVADMEAAYAEINANVEIQVVYSNSLLTREEFTSREGAHSSDHYIVVGSADR